ncbi:putative integral membrane protein [Brugia pahangi]
MVPIVAVAAIVDTINGVVFIVVAVVVVVVVVVAFILTVSLQQYILVFATITSDIKDVVDDDNMQEEFLTILDEVLQQHIVLVLSVRFIKSLLILPFLFINFGAIVEVELVT